MSESIFPSLVCAIRYKTMRNYCILEYLLLATSGLYVECSPHGAPPGNLSPLQTAFQAAVSKPINPKAVNKTTRDDESIKANIHYEAGPLSGLKFEFRSNTDARRLLRSRDTGVKIATDNISSPESRPFEIWDPLANKTLMMLTGYINGNLEADDFTVSSGKVVNTQVLDREAEVVRLRTEPWPTDNPVYSNGQPGHPDDQWHHSKEWKDWTKESKVGSFIPVNVRDHIPHPDWEYTDQKIGDHPIPWYARSKNWNDTYARWQQIRIGNEVDALEYTDPKNFPMCYNIVNLKYDHLWLEQMWKCHDYLFSKIPHEYCGAHWANPQTTCRFADTFVELHYLGSESIPIHKRTAYTKCYNVAAGLWWILTSCLEGKGQAIIPSERSLLAIKIHSWNLFASGVSDGSTGGLVSATHYEQPS